MKLKRPDSSMRRTEKQSWFRRAVSNGKIGAMLVGTVVLPFLPVSWGKFLKSPELNYSMVSAQVSTSGLTESPSQEILRLIYLYFSTGNPEHKAKAITNYTRDTSYLDPGAFTEKIREKIEAHEKLKPVYEKFIPKDGGKFTFTEFLNAIEMAKARPREAIATYGQSFVDSVTVRIPVKLKLELRGTDPTILGNFADAINTSVVTKDVNKIVERIIQIFPTTNVNEAYVITQGLYDLFKGLDESQKKEFYAFLLSQNTRILRSMGIAVSGRLLQSPLQVIRQVYETWAKEKDLVRETMSQDESKLVQEIQRLPILVREKTMPEQLAVFELNPTGLGLEYLAQRLAYVSKMNELVEIRRKDLDVSLQQEETQLNAWLEARSKVGEPAVNLARLNEIFQVIETDYLNIDQKAQALAEYVRSLQFQNPLLCALGMRYLLTLDQNSMKLFSTLSVSASSSVSQLSGSNIEFVLTEMEQQLIRTMIPERLDLARQSWTANYAQFFVGLYGPALQQGQVAAALPTLTAEELLARQAAQLPSLVAYSFINYFENAQRNGVVSITSGESAMVATTVAQLLAIDSLLAINYFNAITHLSNVCRGNQQVFSEGLKEISVFVVSMSPQTSQYGMAYASAPVNTRESAMRLSSFFDNLLSLKESAVSVMSRYRLLDDYLQVNPVPPHDIRQREVGYIYSLTPQDMSGNQLMLPNPFPLSLSSVTSGSQFGIGNVGTSFGQYGGNVTLPQFNFLQVRPTDEFRTSLLSFIWQSQPMLNPSSYLPGTQISGLSPTLLLKEIRQAMISPFAPEYSFEHLGGSAAGGLYARRGVEDWTTVFGGLGAGVTPTGGWAFGGQKSSENAYLLGGQMLAVPIGNVQQMEGGGVRIIGIDSAAFGIQKMDEDSSKHLAGIVGQVWDKDNPTSLFLTTSGGKTATDEWMQLETYYLDKQGTLYRLREGRNSAIRMLNYAALDLDEPLNGPVTVAANVQETDTGGFAVAFDAGLNSGLASIQEVPLLTQEGQPMPKLLEWTPAYGRTMEQDSSGAATYQFATPGKLLRIKSPASKDEEDVYLAQDLVGTYRVVKGKDNMWEVTAGAGAVISSTNEVVRQAAEQGEKFGWRGGAFVKRQTSKYSFGGGLSYSSASENFREIAVVNERERYIAGLKRLTATIYGTSGSPKQNDQQEAAFVGGLLNLVGQWKEEYSDILQPPTLDDVDAGKVSLSRNSLETETKFDNLFWNFIGLLRWASVNGTLNISRSTGLEQILTEYDKVQDEVGRDPANAKRVIDAFKQKYAERVRQIFDNYYLGISFGKDHSIQVDLLTKEDGGFKDQDLQRFNTRYLWTFGDRNFVQLFSSIPAYSHQGLPPVALNGIQIGLNGLDSVWVSRFAISVAVMIASEEPSFTGRRGVDVSAATVVYSNVIEDSQRYRAISAEYFKTGEAIEKGTFKDVPPEVLASLLAKIDDPDEVLFTKEIRSKILNKEQVDLSVQQKEVLQGLLYNVWYSPKIDALQEEFDGHLRVYAAANGYRFFENSSLTKDQDYLLYHIDTSWKWNIGAYVEYADRLRAYLIGAKRDSTYLFAGSEITLVNGKFTLGLLGTTALGSLGEGLTDSKSAAAAYARYQTSYGPTFDLGAYVRSRDPREFARYGDFYPRSGAPEVGVLFMVGIGDTKGVPAGKSLGDYLGEMTQRRGAMSGR
ncbi:MAG: hypothetical protein ABII22_05590 [Candidatus Micrarchaeota archaeon]